MLEEFFYLRHAQTDAHVQKLICGGDWDLPLNDAGLDQALDAARRLASPLAGVTAIYSSPLRRAQQTAKFFAQQLHVPIVVATELCEWRLGAWDRQAWESVPHLFDGTADPPGGETRAEFTARVKHALDSLPTHGTLVVAHGALWYEVLKCLGLPPQPLGSCVPVHFESRDTTWHTTIVG